MNIDCWNIKSKTMEDDFKILTEICSTNRFCSFLLNINQPTFSLFEKYIFDIAMFHFKRLDILFDENKHFIQFWWKHQFSNNNFHVDCDKYELYINKTHFYPLLSCVTYLNDNIYPTAITNITQNDNTQLIVPTDNYLFVSSPKKYKHISFDGNNYHGMVNLTNDTTFEESARFILCMNLLDKKPKNMPYYDSLSHANHFLETHHVDIISHTFDKKPIIKFIHDNKRETIEISRDILNESFYENLILGKDTCIQKFKPVLDIITMNKDYDSFLIKTKECSYLFEDTFTKTYPSLLTPTICKWILSELPNIDIIENFIISLKTLFLEKLKVFGYLNKDNFQIINVSTNKIEDCLTFMNFQISLEESNMGDLFFYKKVENITNKIYIYGSIKYSK